MINRDYESKEHALAVAKEAVWLAWQACGGPSGMGFLRNNPGADKEAVWKNAYGNEDYKTRHGAPEDVYADYVFGRMMKLYFRIAGNSLNIPTDECRRDYQSWCGKYPTYSALFDAAEVTK